MVVRFLWVFSPKIRTKSFVLNRPSCKRGGKRWTYSSMVPPPAVFYALFKMEEGKKAWKQKKIPLDDFEAITGDLSASVSFVDGR